MSQRETEEWIQAAAERPAAPSEPVNGDIAAYRRLYRALREAPTPEPSAMFASTMERLTRDHGEQAGPEIWIARGLALLAAAGLALLVVAADELFATLFDAIAGLPWSTAVAVAAALATATALDHLVGRRNAL